MTIKNWLRTTVRVLFAPALMGLGCACGLILMQQEQTHGWLLLVLLGAALLTHAAEHIAPYEPLWNRAQGDAWRDLAHALVNEATAFASVLLLPLLTPLSPWSGLWPTHWALGWQWLLAVLVADAGITLAHALSHHWAPLWRLHAVHHSVERFHGLNGLVKHPLHQLVETFAGTAPLVLAGITPEVAGLLALAVGLQLLLQHANVDMRLGPLRHVWAVAPIHRFHHRKWAGVGDTNFGLFTTLWDRLLGTAVDDQAARFGPGDFGIGTDPDYPKAYVAQLLEPFGRRQPTAGPAQRSGLPQPQLPGSDAKSRP